MGGGGGGEQRKQARGRDEEEFAGWMCAEEVEGETARAGEQGWSRVVHAAR